MSLCLFEDEKNTQQNHNLVVLLRGEKNIQ